MAAGPGGPAAAFILCAMKFIDEAIITVKAGDGGNGCLAFRREKFVPRGGPSGGDGGRGGDVVMVASDHNTLLHFRFNPEHTAQRGRHGEGSNCSGKEGVSIELPVPVGTVVSDAETGESSTISPPKASVSSSPVADAAAVATSTSPPPPIRPPPNTNPAGPVSKSASAWS